MRKRLGDFLTNLIILAVLLVVYTWWQAGFDVGRMWRLLSYWWATADPFGTPYLLVTIIILLAAILVHLRRIANKPSQP